MEYVQNARFWLDAISVLGSGVFQKLSRFFVLCGYFKLTRVFRLGKMISQANVDEIPKAVMKLAKLIFYLIFFIHCLACYLWLAFSWNAPVPYILDTETGQFFREYSGAEEDEWKAQGIEDFTNLISYKDAQGNIVKAQEGSEVDI